VKIGTALLFLAWLSTAFAGDVKVLKKGKVFATHDGVEVALVAIEPAGSKHFLVQFTGTTSQWEGRVFEATMKEMREDADYSASIDGKSIVVLTMRRGSYVAYLPDVKRSMPVAYHDKKSTALDTGVILAAFQRAPSSK
jgi:hypothetical protein